MLLHIARLKGDSHLSGRLCLFVPTQGSRIEHAGIQTTYCGCRLASFEDNACAALKGVVQIFELGSGRECMACEPLNWLMS